MINKILGLMGLGLIAGSMAANAQTTTLEYQGDVISGTSTYLPNGISAPTNGNEVTLPSSPFIGTLTATITVDGSVKANDLTLVSYSFAFSGANFVGGNPASIGVGLGTGPAPFIGDGPGFCNGDGGCIDLTTSKNGRITGANIYIDGSDYHSPVDIFDITRQGDSIGYLYATTNGTCQNFVTFGTDPGGNPPYTGGTVNPCSLDGSNSKHGTWIVSTSRAPEIDPASAASGLTLLLGGLAVLRGPKKITVNAG